MNESEQIVLQGESDPGHKKWEFIVGTARYRAVAFDDGSLRVWDIGYIRPSGTNSLVLSPYFSATAREMAREDDS